MPGKQNKNTPAIPLKTQRVKPMVKGEAGGIPRWAIFAVLLFTAFLYSRALDNGITYMDDDYYILHNQYLRDFSLKGIKAIFTHFYSYNYHPLTTLSNLLEYTAFGLNPLPYHFFNVLLHLLNTWLAYKVVEELSGKRVTALMVAILFAVHPMHVESVAWLSERKDVLYAAFYLGSLLFYLYYLKQGYKVNFYFIALLLFVCSLFSKSAGVTLPILLIAVDMYKGRKINARTISEKIPFLLLSILFGILAIKSQSAGGAIRDLSNTYSAINRVFLFSAGIASYLLRLVAPVGLSAIHFFPDLHGGPLPWYYYLSLPFLLALTWLGFRRTAYRKEIIFGVFFFLITISVMLQIVTVGNALTAERYTYIPYIGLFYILGQWMANMTGTKWNYNIMGVFGLFVLVFSVQTWNRIGVWKDSNVLFTDITEHDPDNWRSSYVYYYWGVSKSSEGNVQGALDDYNKAIVLKPDNAKAYFGRANIYDQSGNLKSALADFNKTISLDPEQANVYNGRGWVYYESGDTASAMRDFNKAIQINPRYAIAYNNRGWVRNQSGDTKAALSDYDKAIEADPEFDKPYLNKAAIKANTADYNGALEAYNALLKVHPDNDVAYFNRGVTRLNMQDMNGACEDWRKAADLGNKDAPKMTGRYCH